MHLLTAPKLADPGTNHFRIKSMFHLSKSFLIPMNITPHYSMKFVHSTGHESRLNSEGITEHNGFRTKLYSKEELVAELGASML